MEPIQMVDLKNQYNKIKSRIDEAILTCINSTYFINGPEVAEFTGSLQQYLGAKHVIPCANGTDALQIAMMALNLQHGDEVIVPSFTYVATAEVIGLLGLVPVMVDVDPATFNITVQQIEEAITSRTKAIVPVHLFGQCVDMQPIVELAQKKGIHVIEDTAQALGAVYTMNNGDRHFAGTIGDIGCTSFFPSKNLGCYGDGGAIYTNNETLGARLSMIANHGQEKKYVHKYIGVNSRLDSIQAAILNVKLPHLNEYAAARQAAADYYDEALGGIDRLEIPYRSPNSTHVFHQYTLKVKDNLRGKLAAFLKSQGIPSMVYYPLPLSVQEAYKGIGIVNSIPVTEDLCTCVLSIPMHTELTTDQLGYITDSIRSFFNEN